MEFVRPKSNHIPQDKKWKLDFLNRNLCFYPLLLHYTSFRVATMNFWQARLQELKLHRCFGFAQKCLDNIFQNWGFWCANAALQVELCRLAVQPETLQEPAKGRRDRRGRGFPPSPDFSSNKTFFLKRPWITTNPPTPRFSDLPTALQP